MLTVNTVLRAFRMLESSGLRPPPIYGTDAGRAESVEAWCLILGDLHDEELVRAVALYCRSNERFWPTPGALLALLHAGTPGAVTADDAWGCLLDCLRRHGSYATPLALGQDPDDLPSYATPFRLHDDPEVEARMHAGLRAIGGWSAMRELPASPSEQAPTAAAFRRSYEAAERRKQATALPALTDGRERVLRLVDGLAERTAINEAPVRRVGGGA